MTNKVSVESAFLLYLHQGQHDSADGRRHTSGAMTSQNAPAVNEEDVSDTASIAKQLNAYFNFVFTIDNSIVSFYCDNSSQTGIEDIQLSEAGILFRHRLSRMTGGRKGLDPFIIRIQKRNN